MHSDIFPNFRFCGLAKCLGQLFKTLPSLKISNLAQNLVGCIEALAPFELGTYLRYHEAGDPSRPFEKDPLYGFFATCLIDIYEQGWTVKCCTLKCAAISSVPSGQCFISLKAQQVS